MKSYEQMARSVLSRRDQIIKRQQVKKARFFKYAARVSASCGALALCVGALAVWNNIKDTQKNLDEFVRPTEPTTQTTVSLPDSDNENENNNDTDNVVQDSAETTAPAVTTKVVVTSVSKNKDGEKVIVTTEVAVPITNEAAIVLTKPVIVPAPKSSSTSKPVMGPSPKPTSASATKYIIAPIQKPTTKTTTKPIIGPSPKPTLSSTSKPIIGPTPKPTSASTSKLVIGPVPRPTSASTTAHKNIPLPIPTTIATTARPTPTIVTTHTTIAAHPTEVHTTTLAPQITTYMTHTTYSPVMTLAPDPVQTHPPHTTPYPVFTTVAQPEQTKLQCTTTAPPEASAYVPLPQVTTNNGEGVNPNDSPYNTYDSFEVDGRYFHYINDTYYGEAENMTMYYSGTASFHDWDYQPVYEDISIYSYPGEYRVIVYLSSQGRYMWYNVSSPFY